jgi:hypothetical protein
MLKIIKAEYMLVIIVGSRNLHSVDRTHVERRQVGD